MRNYSFIHGIHTSAVDSHHSETVGWRSYLSVYLLFLKRLSQPHLRMFKIVNKQRFSQNFWSSSPMMSDLNSASLSLSLTSTNSANSFNFVDVLDPDEFQLLSPSISLESLWSTDSDEPVPPFPERPAVRITPMLLDDRCMSHPFGRGKQGPDNFRVLTSAATPPRMRYLLLEPLCIDRWVVRFISSASTFVSCDS